MPNQCDVVCSEPRCGFRVHDRYFEQKKRFMPGICPRCNAPIKIVEAGTNKVVAGAVMGSDGRIEVK